MKKETILDLLKNFKIDKFEISNEAIQEIKNNEIFVELSLTDKEISNNIVFLKRVIDENENCKKSDECPYSNYHLKVKRLVGKLYFYNDFCSKTKDHYEKNVYKNLILYNYYRNDKNKDIKFDNDFLNENNKGLKKSKVDCIQKFICIMNNNENEGMYIYGKPGVGKTYLSIAMANTAASKYKKTVCLAYMPEIVEIISSKIDNKNSTNSSDEFIETLKNADLLFIDDLGAEYGSEWFYCNYFLNLLNLRLSNGKLTFFNSNLTISEYSKKIQSKIKSSDSRIIVDRIIQRIDGLVGKNIFTINSK